MTKEEFKTKAEELIEQLESLIEQMPNKVDTSESQKVLLQNQLNQFSYAVNGVEDMDFMEYYDINDEYSGVTLEIPAYSLEHAMKLSESPEWDNKFKKEGVQEGNLCPNCFSNEITYSINGETTLQESNECYNCGHQF